MGLAVVGWGFGILWRRAGLVSARAHSVRVQEGSAYPWQTYLPKSLIIDIIHNTLYSLSPLRFADNFSVRGYWGGLCRGLTPRVERT